MKKILKFFLFLSLILCAFAFVFKSDFFKLKKIEIASQDKLSFDFLNQELASLKGKLIFNLSMDKIIQKIESYDRVKRVWVFREWPDSLKIKISSETAFLYILDSKKNKIYSINSQGDLREESELKILYPFVRGKSFLKNSKKRQQLVQFLSRIPDEGLFSLQEISEIYQTKPKELTFVLTKSKTRLLLPFHKVSSVKIQQIEDVLEYLYEREKKTFLVDARLSKKIVVKLHK